MRISEIAELAGPGLTPVFDATEERTVESVYTTDLPLPGIYLAGGELVLTSGIWYREPGDAERFVASLARAGCAALVVGTLELGALPRPLYDACVAHDLPLLTAETLSFAVITESITAHLAGPGGKSPAADLHRRLLVRLAAGAGPSELVVLLGRATGVPCALLSASGEVVSGNLDADVTPLFRASLAQGAVPWTERVPGEDKAHLTLYPIHDPIPRRPPFAYLVLEGRSGDWAPGVADAAHEMCCLVAIERAKRLGEHRLARRILRDAFDMIRANKIADAEQRLGTLGYTMDRAFTALAISSHGTGYGAELAGTLLEDIAAQVPGATVPLDVDGVGVVLLPTVGTETDVADLATRIALRMAPLVASGWIAIGTSAPRSGLSDLRVALDQVQHAHRIASDRSGQVRLATSRDLNSHLLLLSSVPDDVQRLFRAQLIGVLEKHDRGRNTDLVGTVTTFLEESCAWNRTAERLRIHVNTLRYRLQRVEELTGRSLDTLDARIDFRLAIRMEPERWNGKNH